jgi:hypothetical protein
MPSRSEARDRGEAVFVGIVRRITRQPSWRSARASCGAAGPLDTVPDAVVVIDPQGAIPIKSFCFQPLLR